MLQKLENMQELSLIQQKCYAGGNKIGVKQAYLKACKEGGLDIDDMRADWVNNPIAESELPPYHFCCFA